MFMREESMSLREDLKLDNPIPADYNVPYFVHQDDLNKLDQSHKRVERWLAILCIIIFIALIGTNGYWIWYEQQYEDVTTTVTQEVSSEGGGDAVIHGEKAGAVFYGESETDSYDKN